MSVAAAPRATRSILRAVIEEARRHARRRRIRALSILLACVGAGLLAYFVSRPSHSSGSATRVVRVNAASNAAAMHNGELTLMDLAGDCPPSTGSGCGWYAISSVAGAHGLRPLVRCPYRKKWCGEVESIDWSPNGRELAFGVTSYGLVNPYNGLHVIDTTSGRDHLIVKMGERHEYDWVDIDWAPNGLELAYAADGHIVVVAADGTYARVLQTGTVGHDHSPSWSPDGRWIAFASRHDGHSSVYVMRNDGSERRVLAAYGATPAWSPDGSRIAFRGHDHVQFVSPNGQLLAPRIPFRRGVGVGINGPPVWSPDGTKIAMANARSGTWVMNADGTGLKQLTRYSGDALGISERPRPAWRPRP